MFNELLNEDMSAAEYISVADLRTLYYGRLDMYVSFTDNSKYRIEHKNLPRCIVAHTVDSVVGRKVTTNLLYARVFRIKKSSGRFIEDFRNYTRDELHDDIERMRKLSDVKESELNKAVAEALNDGLLRRAFDMLWDITKTLSKGKPRQWQEILSGIGYIGVGDPIGKSPFAIKNSPTTLLLWIAAKKDFDVLPIQKTRRDPRARIRADVDKETKALQTARNRVAKKYTPPTRSEKKKTLTGEIRGLVKALMGKV